jgi:hypothetical protein
LQRRNAVTLADRGGEHVGDEAADGLRLLIVVGACGAVVSVGWGMPFDDSVHFKGIISGFDKVSTSETIDTTAMVKTWSV